MNKNLKTLLLGITPMIWGGIMMLTESANPLIGAAFLIYWGFVSYKLAGESKMETFITLHAPTVIALIVYIIFGQGIVGHIAYSFFMPTLSISYIAGLFVESVAVVAALSALLMTAVFAIGTKKAEKN